MTARPGEEVAPEHGRQWTSSVVAPAQEPAPAVRTPWTRYVTLLALRIVAVVHAVFVCIQPVLAGWYLNGDFDALELHRDNASTLTAVCLFLVIAGLLFWFVGRGSIWIFLITAVLFAAETLQLGYGYARDLGLHIPLGVGIVLLSVALVPLLWNSRALRLRRSYRRSART